MPHPPLDYDTKISKESSPKNPEGFLQDGPLSPLLSPYREVRLVVIGHPSTTRGFDSLDLCGGHTSGTTSGLKIRVRKETGTGGGVGWQFP